MTSISTDFLAPGELALPPFASFAQRVPGLFVFLGGTPAGQDAQKAPSNHSPRFAIDESALKLGVRTLLNLTVDYMEQPR